MAVAACVCAWVSGLLKSDLSAESFEARSQMLCILILLFIRHNIKNEAGYPKTS